MLGPSSSVTCAWNLPLASTSIRSPSMLTTAPGVVCPATVITAVFTTLSSSGVVTLRVNGAAFGFATAVARVTGAAVGIAVAAAAGAGFSAAAVGVEILEGDGGALVAPMGGTTCGTLSGVAWAHPDASAAIHT